MTSNIHDHIDATIANLKKPTKEQYLRRAKMSFVMMEKRNRRSIEISGKPMSLDSASHRFLGRSMWHNLMGWAGFPM